MKRFYLMIVLLLVLTGCNGTETREELPTTAPTPVSTLTPTAVPTSTSTPTPTIQTEPPDGTAVTDTPTPTASVAPCQKPPSWISYSIRSGDTLFSLGQATDSSVDELMAVNCLTSDRILAGQPLYLPKEPNFPTVTSEKPDPVTPSPSPFPTDTPWPTETPSPTATTEQGPAPGPGDPRLEILPFSGSIPTQYTATLEEYKPNQTVTIEIYFNQTGALVLTGTVIVDDGGNGVFIFSSEEGDQPGLYTLFATGEGGFPYLFGEFQIGE